MAIKKRASVGGAAAIDQPAIKKPALSKRMRDSKLVAETLNLAVDLPAEAVASLREAAPHCLSTYKDQRHEYQESIVVMIGKALDGIEAGLQTHVQGAEVNLEGMDKFKLEASFLDHVRNVANAKAAVAHRDADRTQAKFNSKKTSEIVNSEMKLHTKSAAQYSIILERKKIAEDIFAKAAAIKASPPDIKTLTNFEVSLTSLNVDPSLIPTLSSVLLSTETRSEFDQMTLKNMDDEIAAKVAGVTAELKTLEAEQHDRAAALNLAQQAQIAASTTMESAGSTLKQAHQALDEHEIAVVTVEDSIKNFTKALKRSQDELAAAQRELADFQRGPLATYSELKSATTPLETN